MYKMKRADLHVFVGNGRMVDFLEKNLSDSSLSQGTLNKWILRMNEEMGEIF